MKRLRVLGGMVLAGVGVLLCGGAPIAHAAGPAVNGGGSSFASLEIDQWRAEVARSPYNLTINYVAQGSTFGRSQYIAGNFDWAASDIPFVDSEIDAVNGSGRSDYAYVPISAGGLGFMYNVIDPNSGSRVESLRLSRRAVCRMFTEPGILWSDPEIQDVNPEVVLPAEEVRPIVRQDGSGTSYVLSEFCSKAAPDVWQAFIAKVAELRVEADPEFQRNEPTSNWPRLPTFGSGVAADGVAAIVADPGNGRNTITYNEAGFAKVWGFPNAYVQNTAGAWLLPEPDYVSRALQYATAQTDSNNRPGTFQLNYDAADPEAYFPSTYSYAIVQTTGFPEDKGEVLARFLCYAVTTGQRKDLTDGLGYAQLSAELVAIARTSIEQIPGAPAWDDCRPSDAPPPPESPSPTPTPDAGSGGGGTGGGVVIVIPGGGTTGGGDAAGGGTTGGGGGDDVDDDGGANRGNTAGNGSGSGNAVPGAAGSSAVPGAAGSTTGTASALPAGATASCTDPITGEQEFDLAICESFGAEIEYTDAAGVALDPQSVGGASAPAGQIAAPAGPAAANPTVLDDDGGPEATEVTWVLLQGGGVCGLGVAVAGLRRRVSL